MVAIHLLISSTFTALIGGEQVTVRIDSGLPWAGNVQIKVESSKPIDVAIRIPEWTSRSFKSSIQGDSKDGYFFYRANSSPTEFELSVAPKFVCAHPDCDKNEVAVTRGPLVYCAESPDNDFDLEHIYIDTEETIVEAGSQRVGGISAIPFLKFQAEQRTAAKHITQLYYDEIPPNKVEMKTLRLLPYFARANRGGDGAMRVWLKRVLR